MRPHTAFATAASAAVLVLAPAGTASSAAPVWRWPVDPPVRVVRGFDAPAGPYGPGHRGVDLAALPGTPVLAATDGTVVVAGVVAGEPVVVLAHGVARTFSEIRTTYEPALPSVAVGAQVRRGQRIGMVGIWPGHCPASTVGCLHWAVRRGEIYLDPTLLMRGPVRLLPVGPPVSVPAMRSDDVAHAGTDPARTVAAPDTEAEPGRSVPGRSEPPARTASAGLALASVVAAATVAGRGRRRGGRRGRWARRRGSSP